MSLTGAWGLDHMGVGLTECMRPGLEEVMGLLGLLVPLITSQDQVLGRFITDAGVPPYFALSWVLTWSVAPFIRYA